MREELDFNSDEGVNYRIMTLEGNVLGERRASRSHSVFIRSGHAQDGLDRRRYPALRAQKADIPKLTRLLVNLPQYTQ